MKKCGSSHFQISLDACFAFRWSRCFLLCPNLPNLPLCTTHSFPSQPQPPNCRSKERQELMTRMAPSVLGKRTRSNCILEGIQSLQRSTIPMHSLMMEIQMSRHYLLHLAKDDEVNLPKSTMRIKMHLRQLQASTRMCLWSLSPRKAIRERLQTLVRYQRNVPFETDALHCHQPKPMLSPR